MNKQEKFVCKQIKKQTTTLSGLNPRFIYKITNININPSVSEVKPREYWQELEKKSTGYQYLGR